MPFLSRFLRKGRIETISYGHETRYRIHSATSVRARLERFARREHSERGLRSRAVLAAARTPPCAAGWRAAESGAHKNSVPYPSTSLRAGSTVLAILKSHITSERASPSCLVAIAGWLFAGHRLVMVRDLGLAEQVVVDRNFPDRTFKPGVRGHGADVKRTGVSHRCYAELAHTSCGIVSGLVP
jgi:hypothetical protein